MMRVILPEAYLNNKTSLYDNIQLCNCVSEFR